MSAKPYLQILFGVALILGLNACSKKAPIEDIVIDNIFINELPPGQTTAAAYMSIKNNTKISQGLNYIHSPVATHIEVHRSIYEDGMMQMRRVKKLSINPGQSQLLEPGGFHLMVFGIEDKIEAGQTFDMTFEFESGVVMTKKVEVRSYGS